MDWMLYRGSKQLLKDDRRLTETGNIMFEQCRQKLFEQLFEQRLIESKPTSSLAGLPRRHISARFRPHLRVFDALGADVFSGFPLVSRPERVLAMTSMK